MSTQRLLKFDEIYMRLAWMIAEQSHCVRLRVGAVITKDRRIVSVGYNGPPSDTINCDEGYPLEGCSSEYGELTVDSGEGCPRSTDGGCFLALHAEENAVLWAAKNSVDLDGACIYLTMSPCLPCARLLFQAGIRRVRYKDSYASYKGLEREEGCSFLSMFGVDVQRWS